MTDSHDSLTPLDGTLNRFDLVTAGSAEPGWVPNAQHWQQGNTRPYRIALTPDGSTYVMSPGASLTLRIAVKNVSTRLASDIELSIENPNDHGGELDPESGNFVDLFPQLRFTVGDGESIVFANVPGSELQTVRLPGKLRPDDYRMLDIRIDVSEDLDNRWQLATTDVQFALNGSST